MSFTEEYGKRRDEFEKYLHQFARELMAYPHALYEAVTYSLLGKGKRLRPILLLETVRMFGGKPDAPSVNFALALECIHTYSLIHDDLPCMDDDDFRRGEPTCHKKFGEANAVLAGDTLLNLAYELIFSAVELGGRAQNYLRAGLAIASAAGGNGLIGGQVIDLSPSLSADNIDYVYKHKTGALIKAALVAGAYIAGAGEDDVAKIEQVGELFGYGFQLSDDLLDKDDEAEGKGTYLSIFGEEKTRQTLKEKTVEALSILQTMDNSEFLLELTANFMERSI